MRALTGWQDRLSRAICLMFALVFVLAPLLRIRSYVLIPVFVCIVHVLAYMHYPARRSKESQRGERFTLWDSLLAVAMIGSTVYYLVSFERMASTAGMVSPPDALIGGVTIILSLEATRRTMGWLLPGLAILGLMYAWQGPLIPGTLGHPGFSLSRLAGESYSIAGVYGSIAGVFAGIVFIFLVFGAFLSKTGTGDFLHDLAKAGVGRLPGGAGHAAVAASGLVGSFIGSGAANISITGTMTIPVMKRGGFAPRVAGAIEVVASSGGHILPPVMGATVFLMASFTGIPYREIMLAALLPALLYYIGLLAHVGFYAKKHGLAPLPRSEIPSLLAVVRGSGHLAVPLTVLVYLLFGGFSPARAGLYTIVVVLIVSALRRHTRLDLRQIVDALVDGAKSVVLIGSIAGTIGIMIHAITIPGLPVRFASFALGLSGGYLLPLIVLSIIVSYVFGMGLSMAAAYALLAVIAAPALVEAGVPLLIAHLIIVWFALDTVWTPPFALGAHIASPIASVEWSKIAWTAVGMGKALYIIPLLMVYTPLADLSEPVLAILWFVFGSLGLGALAVVIQGFLIRKVSKWGRVSAGAISAALLLPTITSSLVGSAALLLFFVVHIWQGRVADQPESLRRGQLTP